MVSVFQEIWNEGEAAMAEFIKLPVGIENFEKIRRDGFYYVDKTGLIEQLLNNWGEVNLFTRPRRFGKTLNMSMLCLLYTSPSPRDRTRSRMPSSA